MLTPLQSPETNSHNTESGRNRHSGKEIEEEKDLSSVSTMSSVDIDEYVSDVAKEQESILVNLDNEFQMEDNTPGDGSIIGLGNTNSEKDFFSDNDSDTDNGVTRGGLLVKGEPNDTNEKELESESNANTNTNSEECETWSLFDGSEVASVLDEKYGSITQLQCNHENDFKVTDSHDSSHFIEATKRIPLEDSFRGESESFLIPRPDSSGNFLHTSSMMIIQDSNNLTTLEDSENGVKLETKSVVTILSSKDEEMISTDTNEGTNATRKEEELLSLGADILMEKSQLTGKITLESDPSHGIRSSTQQKQNRSTSTENFHFPTHFLPSIFDLDFNRFFTQPLSGFILAILTAVMLILTVGSSRAHWKRAALTLQEDFLVLQKDHLVLQKDMELLYARLAALDNNLSSLREDLKGRDNKLREMESRERDLLNELANATKIQNFSWEDEQESAPFFKVDNCWLNAEAFFELGYCPLKLKEDILRFFRVDQFYGKGKRKEEADSDYSNGNVVENIGDLAKEFANVLLPKDPKGLLDGTVWMDLINGANDRK